jgi:hypothetical protein
MHNYKRKDVSFMLISCIHPTEPIGFSLLKCIPNYTLKQPESCDALLKFLFYYHLPFESGLQDHPNSALTLLEKYPYFSIEILVRIYTSSLFLSVWSFLLGPFSGNFNILSLGTSLVSLSKKHGLDPSILFLENQNSNCQYYLLLDSDDLCPDNYYINYCIHNLFKASMSGFCEWATATYDMVCGFLNLAQYESTNIHSKHSPIASIVLSYLSVFFRYDSRNKIEDDLLHFVTQCYEPFRTISGPL